MNDNSREALRCFNIFVSEFDACYHSLALKLGMSDSVLNILYTLTFEGDGINQSALYKMTGLSKQTINSSVRKLEREEIILLKSGTGRNTVVYLTDKGKALCKEKVLPIIEKENEIFSSWDKNKRENFLRMNAKYLAELTEAFSSL